MTSRQCARKACVGDGRVFGREQVCHACRVAATLCGDCGEPHGGKPGTTKFCRRCRGKRQGKPRSEQNPPWTDAEDELLREVYATFEGRRLHTKLKELFPSRPSWSPGRRAIAIGATSARTRDKNYHWSTEEDAVLREVCWMTPENARRHMKNAGFSRSLTAISIRMKRLNLRQHIDGMSATGLADQLGVDSHLVIKWIHEGYLKASRAGTSGDQRDRWYIPNSEIARFLLEHPALYSLSRIEVRGGAPWFFEMISIAHRGGTHSSTPYPAERTVALGGERITITALSEISGRSVADLLDRIDERGMSVEKAAFDHTENGEDVASDLAATIGAELSALAKIHRASPSDLARWTGIPKGIVVQVLRGGKHALSGAFTKLVDALDGELVVWSCPK